MSYLFCKQTAADEVSVCVCVCNVADGSHLHLQTMDSSLADGAVLRHA